ncbi:MAG: L,D-transpeptidase family protein [Chloroflexota bacterium]|nr:L,D-transpeptidase family protein [Chloroflexota bacterium]
MPRDLDTTDIPNVPVRHPAQPRLVVPSSESSRLSRRAFGIGAAGIAAGVALRSETRGAAAQTAYQVPPAVPGRYFPLTGHNLREPFLSRWEEAGAEAVLGAPLSEEWFLEDVGVVQSFEALTLVFDPALTAPFDVQGVALSRQVRDDQSPAEATRGVAGCSGRDCQFFPDTGHTLSGDTLAFWASHGGQAVFGSPVSEPFRDRESGATVQVFGAAVLEQDGDGAVRARALGRMLAERDGLFGTAPFSPAPPTGGETTLVSASDGLRLRDAPSLDGPLLVVLPDNAEFIAVPNSTGEWVAGYVDGYAGWVVAAFLTPPVALPQTSVASWDPTIWQGAALSETNVRARPTTDARVVEELVYGDDLTVRAWVKGEELFEGADLWAQVGRDRFVYARNVGRTAPVAPPPVPGDAPQFGPWIDVNLTQQLMVAYDGRTPVRTVVTTTGMAGWETPTGYFSIINRVPNETMTSGAIGAEHFYKLEDVLFTQYFTEVGHAIHYAWWRTAETIGRPGSHGCLNVLLDDARFFWDWADYGTGVYVHY